MKSQTRFIKAKLFNGILIAALVAAAFYAPGISQVVYASKAEKIDASADEALDRFYKQVKGAKEFAAQAKGLLIMPSVKKAGLIIGGEYGRGALRIAGKTVDYYNVVSGSFGFQIGAEAKDLILMFMTDEALKNFRASKGWEAGLDGNVAIIKVGGGDSVNTRNIGDPIVGFVFDVKGLIGDISLKGAKFTKIDASK
jgi:lipid-binding SYLF domain-containing protein